VGSIRPVHIAILVTALALAAGGCGADDEADPPPGAEITIAPAAAARPTNTSEVLTFGDLKSCAGSRPPITGYRCGSIERPKFAAAPERGSFRIGFAVRQRDDRASPSQGAIFAVEGGPGYASSGTANSYGKLFGPLLDHRELVLVDMRGTGRSGPIRCPDIQLARAPDWLGLAECARRTRGDWEAYNTGAAAEDLDAVRQALGLGRIALYGDSYGTYLAQSYAFRHPDQLEALVLDGAYPVRGESPWYPSLITSGNDDLVTACDRSPTCPPGAANRLATAVRLMRAKGMDVGLLIDAIAGGAYGPPESYLDVERAVRAMLAGNLNPWHELIRNDTVAYRDRFSYDHTDELMVGCNDYPMIWEREASESERRAQLEGSIRHYDPKAFAPFTPREVALSSDSGYLECLAWPVPTALREPPVPADAVATDAPVLVVNGELDDLTTPLEGGLVAAQFANVKRFIGRNAGHVDALYNSDGPSARMIRRFLERTLGA
jgi:pimeloyl-ACP methyl ester carboxylesterase